MCESYIQKVLEGDVDAFRHIIREYQDDAYSLAISVVKDENAAKDVTQNAFIKAYSKLNTFQGNSKFSTWLFRITINEAFIKQRKVNRQNKISSEYSLSKNYSDISDYLDKFEEENRQYYINKALKIVPAKYSLALRLFYLKEFSVEEITDITGWSSSNTKVILHRAREKFKTILEDTFNIDKEELY